MLGQTLRLSRTEIEEVVARGRRSGGRDLGLRVRRSGHSPSRFAIVVPAKAVRLSVQRHLIKRRLRSIIRALAPQVPTGFDIVVFCGAASAAWTFAELREQFSNLLSNHDW